MAKNANPETEQYDVLTDEIMPVSRSDLARFSSYINPFDNEDFRRENPDWIKGSTLVGRVISIHSWEWLNSFQYKVPFVKAVIEISGHEGKYQTTFFSAPVLSFFKALDSAKVAQTIVVAVIQSNSSYTFQDVRKFVSENNL